MKVLNITHMDTGSSTYKLLLPIIRELDGVWESGKGQAKAGTNRYEVGDKRGLQQSSGEGIE